MNRRGFLVAGAAGFAIGPSAFAGVASPRATAGDRFTFGDDVFVLSDVIAPSTYSLSGGPAEFAAGARAILGALLQGAELRIADTGEPTRWGERVVRADDAHSDKNIQLALVEQGGARVYPQSDDLAFVDELLRAEVIARNEARGLWASRAYRVRSADNAGDTIGAFHLVEGVVRRAAATKRRFYLNFGADYKTDYTAGLSNKVLKKWRAASFDPARLEGEKVRIRGFVQSINGPSVDLTHMRQIETLF